MRLVNRRDCFNASLVEADFTNARLGVSPLTASFILIGALAVSVLAGVAVGLFAESTRAQVSSSDWRDVLSESLMVAVTLLFLGLLMGRGISTALRAFLISIVVIIIVDFTMVYILAGELRFRNAAPLIGLLVLVVPAATAGILKGDPTMGPGCATPSKSLHSDTPSRLCAIELRCGRSDTHRGRLLCTVPVAD
jgi:hypothetical protein